MPPRYAYWTILAGGLPTAFRAADREDLLPTFQRIREKHPDAEMKWFARGKLWASPEEAQRDRDSNVRGEGRDRRDRRAAGDGRTNRPAAAAANRTPGRSGPPEGEREPRGRDWRPGGEHRDPRQKYKDMKKERNINRRNERFARKHGDEAAREERPRRDFKRDEQQARGDWRNKPPQDWRDRPRGDFRDRKPAQELRDRPRGDWRDRPPREKPHGDKLRPKFGGQDDRARREFTRDEQRPRGDWGSKPAHDPRDRPRGEFRDRKPAQDFRDRPRGDWRDRPPREKPHGDKLRPKFGGQDDRARREFTRDEQRPRGDRGSKAGQDWRDRPRGNWRDNAPRPPREKPHGDKLRAQTGSGQPRRTGTNEAQRRERPQGPGGFTPKDRRPFERKQFERKGPGGRRGQRDFVRGAGSEEAPPPMRPRGPNREPRPSEEPPPGPPPRPFEPTEPPSTPPERGRWRDKPRSGRRG